MGNCGNLDFLFEEIIWRTLHNMSSPDAIALGFMSLLTQDPFIVSIRCVLGLRPLAIIRRREGRLR
jgi:hypothetical protein